MIINIMIMILQTILLTLITISLQKFILTLKPSNNLSHPTIHHSLSLSLPLHLLLILLLMQYTIIIQHPHILDLIISLANPHHHRPTSIPHHHILVLNVITAHHIYTLILINHTILPSVLVLDHHTVFLRHLFNRLPSEQFYMVRYLFFYPLLFFLFLVILIDILSVPVYQYFFIYFSTYVVLYIDSAPLVLAHSVINPIQFT